MTGQLEIAEEATKVNDMEATSNVMTRCVVCTANLLATAVCKQTTAKPAGGDPCRTPGGFLRARKYAGGAQWLVAGTCRQGSPALVQIEVTRFGPAQDEDRKDTVVMVRQHKVLPNAS